MPNQSGKNQKLLNDLMKAVAANKQAMIVSPIHGMGKVSRDGKYMVMPNGKRFKLKTNPKRKGG